MCSNGSALWLSADGSSVCLGGRCRVAGRQWEGNCCYTTGCAGSALLGVWTEGCSPWHASCALAGFADGNQPSRANLGSLQWLQPFSWYWCKLWQVSPCVVSPGLTVSLVASRVFTSRGELPFLCPAPLTSHVLSPF